MEDSSLFGPQQHGGRSVAHFQSASSFLLSPSSPVWCPKLVPSTTHKKEKLGNTHPVSRLYISGGHCTLLGLRVSLSNEESGPDNFQGTFQL